MYFTHADTVWAAHPNLRALAVVVDGVLGVRPDEPRLRELAAAVNGAWPPVPSPGCRRSPPGARRSPGWG